MDRCFGPEISVLISVSRMKCKYTKWTNQQPDGQRRQRAPCPSVPLCASCALYASDFRVSFLLFIVPNSKAKFFKYLALVTRPTLAGYFPLWFTVHWSPLSGADILHSAAPIMHCGVRWNPRLAPEFRAGISAAAAFGRNYGNYGRSQLRRKT